MSLSPGARLGPYEIVSALGAGGMGEVYRARDTRLERVVAIKVLPPHLADDPQFRDRFEHEAKTVSQLDHPHICPVYDVGEERGTSFIVMQYLEGETLSDRLGRGALPLDDALRCAEEIGAALDKAHRAGVVHRDLKPGNIMLTKSGAKLLDFGLARSGVPVLTGSGMSILPTTPAANLTVQGTILGTFQYMAPEQLEGQEADARTDIFAFGAVLYEMLTGRKAFEGKSQATLIAAIVGADPPPVSALQPISPPMVDDVVGTCLAKNREERWQSAADVLHALGLASKYKPIAIPASPRTRRFEKLVWGLAGIVVLALVGTVGWLSFGRSVQPPPKIAFDINSESAPSPLHIALSPDGARLVSIVTDPKGNGLSVRRLDEVTPQTLAATTGAAFPFWSPDGRFIGYFTSGKLNKIDVFGGPPQPLCDASAGYGGAWSRDGTILFAPSANAPLFRVSSGGGIPVAVTEFDKARADLAHRHPKFLPDGQHFVFFLLSAKPENSGLYLGSLDSKETRRVVASDAMGAFVPPDRLVFMRGSTLMGQRFNLSRLEVEGEPSPIVDEVGINTGNSVAGFAFSNNGMLAYRVGGNASERVLRWVDRNGKPLGDVGGLAAHENAALAPDGTKIVETRLDGQVGDIWIVDLTRGTSTRFTFDPAIDDNAIWSPDGNRIVFESQRDGPVRNLYMKNAGGTGGEEMLLKTDSSKFPTDWSSDGRYILYTEVKNKNDVWVLPLFGDRKPIPFLTTPFWENRARFAPDGHWIAYTSDESGGTQVYVQSFPVSGGKWQVSTTGGVEPHWRSDGRELFYVNGTSVWAVDVSADGGTFKPGAPHKLFDAPLNTGSVVSRLAVTPDGQQFLLNLGNVAGGDAVPPIRVVLNWATALKP